IKSGKPFYFLPDMDFGARDAIFSPFFGVKTATITALPRLARLTGAAVLPVVTRQVGHGYVVRFYPAWENYPTDDLDADVRRMDDRHFGIGCDQVLVVEKPASRENDFRYRIFNADGGEVEQCGNGARCFARFVLAEGLTSKRAIRVETASGVIVPEIEASGQVTVDMGPPRFAPR